LQERLERSRAGRVLISLFILVTLVTVLTANLPPSRLQVDLLKADHPYLYATDLQQNWGVFAPDPRSQTVDVLAQVTFADGSTETWQVPRRNPVVGEYIDYRWLKWTEWLVSPAYPELSRPGALYVARRLATPERRPVKVTLIDRSHAIVPPGQPSGPTPSSDRAFYTTTITPAMLRGGSG
jgi:hypothetical protein